MTEEDTFIALRRDPFRKVAIACFQFARVGEPVFSYDKPEIQSIIEKSGWTLDELNRELEEQIKSDNIRLWIHKIKNPTEQQRFLETGII